MLIALALQASLLARPLFLEERPPEPRALRVLVLQAGAEEQRADSLARIAALRERLLAGEDFEARARSSSTHASAPQGGVLGSFVPGVLPEALDRFLFAAATGEISEPLTIGEELWLAQRIEALAGVRQILIAGAGAAEEARARELLGLLRAGADFEALAREHSQEPASAARGGAFAIYERGPRDALLKDAAFRAGLGEVVGPIRSSLGLHLVQRVPPASLDPALRETTLVRVRAILVSHVGAIGADPALGRELGEALELAQRLAERIRAGADMAELARELDDDPGGRARAGDLGWLHRGNPELPHFMARVFLLRPGELAPLVRCSAGMVLLRREL